MLKKENRVLIEAAPMAGISDWIFRMLAYEKKCDIAYTEMINALGYLCAPENNRGNQEILTLHPKEKHTIGQIFGKEPEPMGEAAKALVEKYNFKEININMGCPAKKIAGKGEGVALMKEPLLAENIIKKTVKSVKVPVSIKIRLGWDESNLNGLSFAKMAEDAGVSKIVVHGRTKVQGYSGTANWDLIREIKENVKIPVVANGDIVNGETAKAVIEKTNCDSIMIGRGALGNPWIFEEIYGTLNHESYHPPTLEEKIETALCHGKFMVEWKEEKYGIVEMRKHIAWYLTGLRGANVIRAKINKVQSFCQVEDILLQYLSNAKNEDKELAR